MKVDVVETTLVAPSEATPRRELWLSNLDLFVPNKHTPLVYYYPAPAPATTDGAAAGEGASFFAPERLKSALAKALVPFYPLAGRLGEGEGGRPQIDCNGEGALFIVARADFTGEEVFQDYRPSPEFRRMFVPFTAPSGELAMFQVTFLKCGGVVLGTGIHHVPIDGIGSFHFIQAWARLSRGGLDDAAAAGDDDQTPAPFHDRTLLRARSPPTPSFDHPVYSLALLTGCPRPSVARVYSVSPALLADLKSRCAPAAASTYCAVAAHLWRCMCVARALGLGSSDAGGVTRLRMTTNARHRLRPPLPRGYSGNAIMRDLVAARVADVLARPLGFTAQAIRDAVDRVDDAYVRSAVDYLEILDLESSDSENNSNNNNKEAHGQAGQLMPESDMWLVSWLGMPMYDADFGWGAPRLVAPAQTFGSGTGYVTPRASEDDGVVVIFALEPEYQQCFQKTFYGD